jgi:hypothetical protein
MQNLSPAMQERLDKWQKQPREPLKKANPLRIQPQQTFINRKREFGDDHENFPKKEKR